MDSISKVTAVYFSPTGNTEKCAVTAAKKLAAALSAEYAEYDFTCPADREAVKAFGENDLVVFAVPVYAGRVPNKVLPMIQNGFAGNGALAVPMVTWGGRNYDNGLIELRNELENLGFHTVAAAAVACGHAFATKITPERPDADDLAVLEKFADKTARRIIRMEAIPAPVGVPGDDPVGAYYTPLGMDGEPAKFLKAKPLTDSEKCDRCGICAAHCPMGSIDRDDPAAVTGICIKCHACVTRCPQKAKYFDDDRLASHIEYLETHFAGMRKASEFFL